MCAISTSSARTPYCSSTRGSAPRIACTRSVGSATSPPRPRRRPIRWTSAGWLMPSLTFSTAGYSRAPHRPPTCRISRPSGRTRTARSPVSWRRLRRRSARRSGVAAGERSGTRNHAIALPPIACPTGVRFPWPPPNGSAQTTGYVPYDGTSLEPVDSRGFLDDLNGNGTRDPLATMQEAWRRLGLLNPSPTLTGGAYVDCVTGAVDALVRERLLAVSVASWYIAQARRFPNVPW